MIKTTDITPTWESLVLTLASLYTDGTTFESRKIAEEELLRMAKIADILVKERKEGKN
jgi:hypothetical protein